MKVLSLLFLCLVSNGSIAEAGYTCLNSNGESQRIDFSLDELVAHVNAGPLLKCRESQATSAFFCRAESDGEDDFRLVVNLDRDRRPVSARMLNAPGQSAFPCHME